MNSSRRPSSGAPTPGNIRISSSEVASCWKNSCSRIKILKPASSAQWSIRSFSRGSGALGGHIGGHNGTGMNEEIRQSVLAAALAIERLNQAFEKRADALRQAGDAKELTQWLTATHAMRDSGNIYLAWAKHYARSGGTDAAAEESEPDELLDEGSSWPPDQHLAP